MRNAPQGQRRQIMEGLTGPPLMEPAAASGPPKRRENLEVHKLRGNKLLSAQPTTREVSVGAVVRESGRQH